MSETLSVEPSSTTMISAETPPCDWSEAMASPMKGAPLKVGMITETSGGRRSVGAESGVMAHARR